MQKYNDPSNNPGAFGMIILGALISVITLGIKIGEKTQGFLNTWRSWREERKRIRDAALW